MMTFIIAGCGWTGAVCASATDTVVNAAAAALPTSTPRREISTSFELLISLSFPVRAWATVNANADLIATAERSLRSLDTITHENPSDYMRLSA
jgi:hypothetical protein